MSDGLKYVNKHMRIHISTSHADKKKRGGLTAASLSIHHIMLIQLTCMIVVAISVQ